MATKVNDGNDYFAAEAQSPDGNLQRDCGIAHGHAMANADEFRDAFFEFLDVGTVVGEPVAVQHVVDSIQEMFAVADIGPANVDFFSECGRISENRQALGLRLGISLGHFIGEACSRSSHGYTIPGHRRISGVFRQASHDAE